MKKSIFFLLAILIASFSLPQTSDAQKSKTPKIKIGEELLLFHGSYGIDFFSTNLADINKYHLVTGSKIKIVDITSKNVVVQIIDGPHYKHDYGLKDCRPNYYYRIVESDYRLMKTQLRTDQISTKRDEKKESRLKAIHDREQKILDKYRNK